MNIELDPCWFCGGKQVIENDIVRCIRCNDYVSIRSYLSNKLFTLYLLPESISNEETDKEMQRLNSLLEELD